MTAILNLLDSIAQFAQALGSFVVSTLQSLFVLLSNIPSYINFLVNTFTIVPAIILPFLLASISIYVVYLILGR